MKSKNWTMASVWNKALENREERPVQPRTNMWASELAKSDVDVYLKLIGTPPTNYPDARGKRKMEAGNIWEWIIKLVLMRCGIYQTSQVRVAYRMPEIADAVEVTGKLDHIAGGTPNYAEARAEIDNLLLPDLFKRASLSLIEHFEKEYPDGVDEKIIEVKSISSFGYEAVESTNKALAGHDLQLFHYVYSEKKEGAIVYISRDDARMYEIPILPNDRKLLERYKAKIARISDYYNRKLEPEKEPAILFDENTLRFRKNFNAQYSMFLTRLYGYEHESQFDAVYSPLTERWNRVLGRLKEGKEMTVNNLEAVKEMQSHGFDIEKIKSKISK